MEILIQTECEHLCYLVLLNAVRCLSPRLKLAFVEENETGSVYTLMPEAEALFALSSDGNVFTLTESVRRLLRPGHKIERAVSK